MEEAEQARVAARDAVTDVTPPALRETIDERLAGSSMVPGALAVHAAAALPGEADEEEVVRRAAGVQLVYEGLALTRTLVAEEPWADVDLDATGDLDADLDVLAADVLVARGFRLLARTEAATGAVEVVREFGREQTDSERTGPSARGLEAAVFELAVVAGATATGSRAPPALTRYAVGLAAEVDRPLRAADEVLPETVSEVMARVVQPATDDRARPHSATDS